MQVFAMTAVLNIAIAGVLLWRITAVLPYYVSILMAMWGYESSHSIDPPRMGMSIAINETMNRTFNFFMDFVLARFLIPWPMDFFIGNGSPTAWRLGVGFADQEIGVRKSRKWDEKLAKGWLDESSDGEVYKERIMPAIDRQWVKAKTSYLMMDKSWDLDFAAMLNAHHFVRNGTNKLQDFEKTVFVYSEDFGWLVWQVWKLDDGAQDEGRHKILTFKEKLTAMGKEDLFYRWIEIVQYETSQPGGFTEDRQAKTMEQARELFQKHNVDFDEFWESIKGEPGAIGGK